MFNIIYFNHRIMKFFLLGTFAGLLALGTCIETQTVQPSAQKESLNDDIVKDSDCGIDSSTN